MTKTEQTRARLQSAALRLIAEQGYEATTVAQIAAAAGVSEMTFFRYFASKDAVVIDDPYDPAIGAAVAAQPQSLPAIERVLRGLATAWEGMEDPDAGETRERVRIVASHPTLRARMWESNGATERVIVEALTRSGVEPLRANVAAAACMGALMAAVLDWGGSETGTLGERIRFALAELS